MERPDGPPCKSWRRPISRRSPVSNRHTGKGTAPLTRRTTPIAEERLFLLGDAAGYVEPFTGEGIAWALVAGLAVAPLAIRAAKQWHPSLGVDWSRRATDI